MDLAQMEPYCTANDQVNHSCGHLIHEATSGAQSSRIGEPRQSILLVRSFGVGTASRPVEIGALLTLSRGPKTSQSSDRDFNCFFLETRARYAGETCTVGQGGARGVRDGTPPGLGREPTPGK